MAVKESTMVQTWIAISVVATAAAFILPDILAWYRKEKRWRDLTKYARRRKG